MKTIYEHNPTIAEIIDLTDGMTKDEYLSHWMFSVEHSILDIVLLYEFRNDETTAKKYRRLIPELYQQWQWGLDNISFPL
ncbi:hypothetical protein [Flavobacterium aestuarii]|uniref:hypothetical protein n=1 Tax=Flavobacterium aestuarii TaxID=3149227 RepID=UPI0032B43ED6